MEKVPGLFIRLGVKRPGGPVTPGHSVDFFADESAIAPGLAVFAGTALDFLGVPLLE
jgi:amidohydrolase/hippurate hydrolase